MDELLRETPIKIEVKPTVEGEGLTGCLYVKDITGNWMLAWVCHGCLSVAEVMDKLAGFTAKKYREYCHNARYTPTFTMGGGRN
jgi:hypothetical protein